MPYKRKHPALLTKHCEKCGVEFWVTSAQLSKKRCGSFREKTGCSAEIGRLAQARYRKAHPDVKEAQSQAFNKSREIERAQTRILKYIERYGKEVVVNWVNQQST
jgi:hypothetical protein